MGAKVFISLEEVDNFIVSLKSYINVIEQIDAYPKQFSESLTEVKEDLERLVEKMKVNNDLAERPDLEQLKRQSKLAHKMIDTFQAFEMLLAEVPEESCGHPMRAQAYMEMYVDSAHLESDFICNARILDFVVKLEEDGLLGETKFEQTDAEIIEYFSNN